MGSIGGSRNEENQYGESHNWYSANEVQSQVGLSVVDENTTNRPMECNAYNGQGLAADTVDESNESPKWEKSNDEGHIQEACGIGLQGTESSNNWYQNAQSNHPNAVLDLNHDSQSPDAEEGSRDSSG